MAKCQCQYGGQGMDTLKPQCSRKHSRKHNSVLEPHADSSQTAISGTKRTVCRLLERLDLQLNLS